MEGLQFRVNQKIEFINEEGQLGISTVQDWGRDFFLVTVPLKRYEKRLLHIGDIVTGIYYHNDDKLYMFNSKVVERIMENIPMFKLSLPKNLSRVQRRDYVRIPITLPIKYVEITEEIRSLLDDKSWQESYASIPWQSGTAFDISGGGVNIGTSWPVETGKDVLIHIQTEGLIMNVQGQVVRMHTKILNSHVTYHHGIKFIGLPESLRDQIIGFIFKKYRRIKQKGV